MIKLTNKKTGKTIKLVRKNSDASNFKPLKTFGTMRIASANLRLPRSSEKTA